MTKCEDCALGKFKNESNSTTGCTNCAAGSFAHMTGMPLCTMCFAGFYGQDPGMSECTACASGRFELERNSTTNCSACAPGKFADRKGMATCQLCERGTWSNETSASACVDCARGRFQAGAGSTSESKCLLCAPGSFASLLGTSECGVCAAGSFVGSEGSTECTKCRPGKFGATSGATTNTVCTDCLAGSFANTNGSSICTGCTRGTFVGQNASTECNLCAPGYSSNTSSVICFACPIGRSAGTSGTPECALCTRGTVSSAAGQTACNACAAGKHYDDLGGSVCSSCAPGSFTGTSKNAECAQCDVGSFVNATGATQCAACVAGTAAPLPGQRICKLFASYFGPVVGAWDVTYDDGSIDTFVVAENGTVIASGATLDEPINGRLQPTTGDDSASGWDFRMVDHHSSSTFLIAEAKTGDTVMQVANKSRFNVGQVIEVEPGTGVYEVVKVAAFGSIILDSALEFDHAAGSQVVAQGSGVAEFLLKITNGTLTIDRFAGSQHMQGVGALRMPAVEEEVSLPLLPIVAGTVACLIGLLLCLFFAWRRCQRVKRALPVDPVIDQSNEFNSISPNLPNPGSVGAPKLLGAEQSPNEQRSKAATPAECSDKPETVALSKNQADFEEAESSAQVSATVGSAVTLVQQVSVKGQRPQKQKTKGSLQCPAGHELVDCTLPSRALCDGCGRVLEQGQHAMDCRSCNWILCDTCRWQKAMGAAGLGGTQQPKPFVLDSYSKGQLQQSRQNASSIADVGGSRGAPSMEPTDLEAAEQDEGLFSATSQRPISEVSI